jgi:RimJ/RimL family protein N-acetyltransferase
MNIDMTLNIGKRIRLTGLDEKDAEIESRWTHDAEYLRMFGDQAVRPLSMAAIKKRYESIEKEMDENKTVYFAVRSLPRTDEPTERLIGFVRLTWLNWASASANVVLGIGEPNLRGCGYGSEMLDLMLRYVFSEVNLHRLTAIIPGDNQAAVRLFTKFGFVEEARLRKALYRDGTAHDLLYFGILRREWEARNASLKGGEER